jgi:hypothetical protein
VADFSDDRIRAMLRGRREVRELPMPGTDEDAGIMIGVRVLTEEEIDASRAEAVQYVNALAKRYRLEGRDMLTVDGELLDREIERQLVHRAFVDTEQIDGQPHQPFFKSPQAVRQLDSVMHRTLFHVYLDHQNYVSPLRGLSDADAEGLADALGKGQNGTVALALLDAPTLRNLARTLAVQLQSALSGRSSTSPALAPS